MWDIATLECIKTLSGHTGPVRTLVYSSGRMFSGSYDKTVRAWDVETLACLATLQGAACCMACGRCGQRCTCCFNSLASQSLEQCGLRPEQLHVALAAACHPDTAPLSSSAGHSGAVRALSASPTKVFSGSDDTTIKVRTFGDCHGSRPRCMLCSALIQLKTLLCASLS